MQNPKTTNHIANKLEWAAGDTLTKKIGFGGVLGALAYAIFVDLWGGLFAAVSCLLLRHHDKVDSLSRGAYGVACGVNNTVRDALGYGGQPTAEERDKLMAEASGASSSGASPLGAPPRVSEAMADVGVPASPLKAALSPELRADLDSMVFMDGAQKEQVMADLRAQLGI